MTLRNETGRWAVLTPAHSEACDKMVGQAWHDVALIEVHSLAA